LRCRTSCLHRREGGPKRPSKKVTAPQGSRPSRARARYAWRPRPARRLFLCSLHRLLSRHRRLRARSPRASPIPTLHADVDRREQPLDVLRGMPGLSLQKRSIAGQESLLLTPLEKTPNVGMMWSHGAHVERASRQKCGERRPENGSAHRGCGAVNLETRRRGTANPLRPFLYHVLAQWRKPVEAH